MKFQTGDTVLLLHSNEEGTIVEIMNEDMVLVNVEGVEFPVFTDQIDFPYFHRFSEQSKIKRENVVPEKKFIDQIPHEKLFSKQELAVEGMQLCMIPVYEAQSFEDNISHFKLYLLNTLMESFHFEYSVLYREAADFVLTNTIGAQKDFYLHNIKQEELNDIMKFAFRFSPVIMEKNRIESLEVSLKLRAKTLFHKIDEMHQLNTPSISFLLFENYPDKSAEPYFPLPERKSNLVKTIPAEPPQSVIDLHIDRIPGVRPGMSNYELLQLQLQYFEKYYRLAVAHMQPKLIVIHGIGIGRLRDEIHEALRQKSEVSTFVNQYHPNFGFGATEIYFQY